MGFVPAALYPSYDSAVELLEYQGGVGAAKAEAVGHHKFRVGIVDAGRVQVRIGAPQATVERTVDDVHRDSDTWIEQEMREIGA
ncbi:hypothetical protein [Marinobacterium rhizophilum]|uniref:Uncharacterized protein n=1 Tax=Marinobacterium rhizophilum TaxID=420402 RepID=A0ABY5HFH4_9GAMM|nr:hypothetical protein [Marinobacterium rhizophilum]UTW11097.1 hypothetical protein KDW95_17730 [Marinobacterium rhizophilum]